MPKNTAEATAPHGFRQVGKKISKILKRTVTLGRVPTLHDRMNGEAPGPAECRGGYTAGPEFLPDVPLPLQKRAWHKLPRSYFFFIINLI
jgi:hypothetical protein